MIGRIIIIAGPEPVTVTTVDRTRTRSRPARRSDDPRRDRASSGRAGRLRRLGARGSLALAVLGAAALAGALVGEARAGPPTGIPTSSGGEHVFLSRGGHGMVGE